MRFINELIHRRVPHIIGSYLIAGTSLILFVDWLVNRYTLHEYYTTLSLFGVIVIMPSVIILAYFHGAPGKDEWTKIEKVGIPVNIIFIFLVLLIGHKSYWWISKEINNAAINEDIMIGKIFSNLNDIDLSTDFILKYGLDNYDDVAYIKLKGISDDKLKILYDEIIYYLNRENNYPVTLVSIYDLEDIYMKKGESLLYYDLRSEIRLLEEEVNVFNYIGVLRDSSLNNIMYENNIEYSLSTMAYELQNPIGGNNLIYLPIGRRYHLNYIDTVYTENDTTYSSNFDTGYSFETFILANEDNISKLISDDYLTYIKQRFESNSGTFEGHIENISNEKIIIGFNPLQKSLISLEKLLRISRIYGSKHSGVEERIDDLLIYKSNIETDSTIKYLKEYNETNGTWTKAELYNLNNSNHPLSTNNQLWWEITIPSYLKIDKIYDSTLVASYFKNMNPYIQIKLDDKIYLK